MEPNMEDGILQRRELDLLDRSLQPLLFQRIQARPVRPEEATGAYIAQAAWFEDLVPMDDSPSGDLHIRIGDAGHPQTKRSLPARDSAMHPSVLAAAIADDSRIEDRLRIVGIHLITGKDDGAKLNSAAGCDGNRAVEIGPETFDGLP